MKPSEKAEKRLLVCCAFPSVCVSPGVLGRLIMFCSVTCLLIACLDKLCLIYQAVRISPGLHRTSSPDGGFIIAPIRHRFMSEQIPKPPRKYFFLSSTVIAFLLGTHIRWIIRPNCFISRHDYVSMYDLAHVIICVFLVRCCLRVYCIVV